MRAPDFQFISSTFAELLEPPILHFIYPNFSSLSLLNIKLKNTFFSCWISYYKQLVHSHYTSMKIPWGWPRQDLGALANCLDCMLQAQHALPYPSAGDLSHKNTRNNLMCVTGNKRKDAFYVNLIRKSWSGLEGWQNIIYLKTLVLLLSRGVVVGSGFRQHGAR